MALGFIPDDIRRFILTSIESVPYLEALLICYNNPKELWDAETLAKRLFLGKEKAGELLAKLCSAGFLFPDNDRPGVFGYRPSSPAHHEMVKRVANIYATNLVDVTKLIHGRADSIQYFSDAFRFRKER